MKGKKNWTQKEIQYLKKYAIMDETNTIVNYKQLANKLGRTPGAVYKKSRQLRFTGELPQINKECQADPYMKPFSQSEDRRICYMVKNGSTHLEIAESLGRSQPSVSCRITSLRKKGVLDYTSLWSVEEEKILIKNIKFDLNGYVSNYDELSLMVKRTRKAVSDKVSKLRKSGKITVMYNPKTTSVSAIQGMKDSCRRFNSMWAVSVRIKKSSWTKQNSHH